MIERKPNPKAKRTSPKSAARTSAAGAAKTPNARTKTKGPEKAAPKARPAQAQQAAGKSASSLTNLQISELSDWREDTLARMRALILEADPEMIEERKWRKPSNAMAGVPVWSHDGIVCTGETYKKVVKLTFARGASLEDPSQLFNASLEGGTRRAIDIHVGETVDASAFKALIKAAVALNAPGAKKRKPGAL